MSKLYFRHGTMNSSKTANLLMVAHNYEEQNKKVLIFKPSLDTRSNKGFIESRVGIKHKCIDIDKEFDIFTYVNSLPLNSKNIDCILTDEAQFLIKEQVFQLARIADILNIPVICYGLKNSYVEGELFEGSQALLFYSDSIEEIKTICSYCNHKAIMNLRVVNGKPIYCGEKVKCGDIKNDESYYIPVCRNHYYSPKLKRL